MSAETTKALSVRQPWAWALLEGGKNVENRTWSTNYRGPLVIHAGKAGATWDDIEEVRDLAGTLPRLDYGAFLGVVNLIDCHHADRCEHICPEPEREDPDPDEWRFPCTVFDGWCNNTCSAWAQRDQYHWVINRPVTFSPVAGNGRLGLFVPPPTVLDAVRLPTLLEHTA